MIGEQPPERLDSDDPVPYENMPVFIGSQRICAVVQMEKRRRLTSLVLEIIEYRSEDFLRLGDVISRAEQVTGIETIASSRS